MEDSVIQIKGLDHLVMTVKNISDTITFYTETLPGSADLCFLVSNSLGDIEQLLKTKNVTIVEGIVDRTGARGPIQSIYIRDIDGNLIELSSY